LSRRPDARWRREPADVNRLSELQAELLEEAAKMLKPGGVLVYSTCTISSEENERNVERFVATQGDLEPLALHGLPGEDAGRLRLYPDTDGCDGMFAAAMRSRKCA
jgi:16S rRNA (cytosine967-C5)-methyltransferase